MWPCECFLSSLYSDYAFASFVVPLAVVRLFHFPDFSLLTTPHVFTLSPPQPLESVLCYGLCYSIISCYSFAVVGRPSDSAYPGQRWNDVGGEPMASHSQEPIEHRAFQMSLFVPTTSSRHFPLPPPFKLLSRPIYSLGKRSIESERYDVVPTYLNDDCVLFGQSICIPDPRSTCPHFSHHREGM